jgi:microcystin-dependent protein
MTTPYVGEIRIGGWNFAPQGWSLCDGRLLPISEYAILYTLIGTTYGGDGISTFAVPNLQGRVPLHLANGFMLGQQAGSEQVTLNSSQIPAHAHPFLASLNPGNQATPVGNTPATVAGGANSAYVQAPATAALNAQSIGAAAGGGAPHENRQPYLAVTYIIALSGVFPSQS